MGVVENLPGKGPFPVFTEKDILPAAGLSLQSGGHQNRLHGGTRFKDIQGDLVFPNLRLRILIGVRVEKRVLGPGQDVPAVDLDHQTQPPFGAIFLHRSGQSLFSGDLDLFIQGQDQVLPSQVVGELPRSKQQVSRSIPLNHELLSLPGQIRVIGTLQTFQARIVHPHKAEQLPRQGPLRIKPGHFFTEMNPWQTGGPDLTRFAITDLTFQPDKRTIVKDRLPDMPLVST